MKAFVFFLLFFGVSSAFANMANYNSILIGDQAAGMGGAYTALDEDASAVTWYNPAALAKLRGKSFSAAVGIYKKFDTHYDNEGDLAKGALTANQGFFKALPSSTGSVIRPKQIPALDKYTLSLSILVPEYENFKGDIASQGASVSQLDLTQESIWTGMGIAKRISARESFGIAVYYTARSVTKSVSDRTYVDSTQSTLFTENRAITQNAIVAQMGWHRDFPPNWKLGVMFRPSAYHISGHAQIDQTTISNGAIQTPIVERDLGTRARIPWKLAVGMAYVVPKKWKFAWDISAYGPLEYGDVEASAQAEQLQGKLVVNTAFGGEYAWNQFLKFRSGLFSNFSAHPDPDPAKVRGQGDRVDQVGFAANAALRSGNIEYTFGGYYTGGRGRSVQRINQVYTVVPKVQNVFTMLVGTSYFF